MVTLHLKGKVTALYDNKVVMVSCDFGDGYNFSFSVDVENKHNRSFTVGEEVEFETELTDIAYYPNMEALDIRTKIIHEKA